MPTDPCTEAALLPSPPCTRFTNEDGLDWFWCGEFTEAQVFQEFCNDTDEGDDEVEITKVRADVYDTEAPEGEWSLNVRTEGDWEFWQAEGGIY